MGRFVDRRLQELQEMIRRLVRGELEQRDVGQRDAARMQALAEKSFYYLSEDEIRRMRTRCGRTSSTAASRSRSASTSASA